MVQKLNIEPEQFGLFPRTEKFLHKRRKNWEGIFEQYIPYLYNAFKATADEYDSDIRGGKIARHILAEIPVMITHDDIFAVNGFPGAIGFTPEEIQNALEQSGQYPQCGGNHSHIALNYGRLLKHGINSMLDEIKSRRNELNVRAKKEDERKESFYMSAQYSLEGILHYAKRYQEEARALLSKETDRSRRYELERIQNALEKVPAGPAETLFEAIQSLLIYHFAVSIVESCNISIGRIDYILNDYFRVTWQQDGLHLRMRLNGCRCFL